jgi:hypothetical protein
MIQNVSQQESVSPENGDAFHPRLARMKCCSGSLNILFSLMFGGLRCSFPE